MYADPKQIYKFQFDFNSTKEPITSDEAKFVNVFQIRDLQCLVLYIILEYTRNICILISYVKCIFSKNSFINSRTNATKVLALIKLLAAKHEKRKFILLNNHKNVSRKKGVFSKLPYGFHLASYFQVVYLYYFIVDCHFYIFLFYFRRYPKMKKAFTNACPEQSKERI